MYCENNWCIVLKFSCNYILWPREGRKHDLRCCDLWCFLCVLPLQQYWGSFIVYCKSFLDESNKDESKKPTILMAMLTIQLCDNPFQIKWWGTISKHLLQRKKHWEVHTWVKNKSEIPIQWYCISLGCHLYKMKIIAPKSMKLYYSSTKGGN